MCVLYHPDKHHDPAKKKVSMNYYSQETFLCWIVLLKYVKCLYRTISSTKAKFFCNDNKNKTINKILPSNWMM